MGKRILTLATTVAMLLVAIPASALAQHEEYIVVLQHTERPVPDVANEIAKAHGGEVGFVYTHALQGFTISVPEHAAAGLSRNPRVAYVEPVVEVSATETQPVPTGIERIEGDLNPPTEPMDVDIAILDTGVYIGQTPEGQARSHLDLNLRWVSDCTGAILYPLLPGGCSGSGDFQDYHGHGTHVAGIAGALNNDIGSLGVAPGAVLHSFKVLRSDGTGTSGMILAGIDGVAARADLIEVANMSLGFLGTSQAIDDAIAAATDAGVVFVVAAGNDAVDASQFSPANSPDALAVSALADFDGLPGALGVETCRADQDDTLADFSNFGPTVELAAPGVCIFSTDLNDGYSVKSGTSMASPFVAGAIARYIAENDLPTNNRADVEAIKAAVIGAGVSQTSACGFADVDSSPEPLLFVNGPAFGGDGTCEDGSVVNSPPVADFSVACTDLTCDFTNESTDLDGTIVSNAWDFGDGNNSAATSPSHTYAGPGTYTVELTVTDDQGDPATISQQVEVSDGSPVNNPPNASFSESCADLQCDFTNSSTDPDGDPLTYLWDFGDGNTSTAVSPSHGYAGAGTFTVSLEVSDGTASDTATTTVTLTDPSSSSVLTAATYPILIDGRDAEVAAGVFDADGFFVGGATVEGVWTYLHRNGQERTETASAVTSSEPVDGLLGNVMFTKRFPPNSTVVGFCVTDVSAPGYEYTPSANCASPLSSNG
ncbi:MAG TPA: S8 family serine peptidase [Acidimicrobiia bacterium]|nr:S8 family serine peptidase [Acidimicrobiia bacterium]